MISWNENNGKKDNLNILGWFLSPNWSHFRQFSTSLTPFSFRLTFGEMKIIVHQSFVKILFLNQQIGSRVVPTVHDEKLFMICDKIGDILVNFQSFSLLFLSNYPPIIN